MGFFTQFGLLFANMEWFVIVCLILGLVLLFIEIFQPGFGIFGVGGMIFLIASVVLRAVFHREEDNILLQVFQLLLFQFIIVGGAFGLFLFANKRKWLRKTPFYQNETAVNPEYSDGTGNFSALIGRTGFALTDLRPSGKAEIEGTVYDVVGDCFFIEKGSEIRVNKTEGVKITVTPETAKKMTDEKTALD